MGDVINECQKLTRRFWEAIRKRISGVTLRTKTDSHVINHETLRSDTARTWAWISTFLSQTCSIATAFRIHGTFWPTVWRATDIIFQTCARRHVCVAALTTRGEWTTGRWNARILWRHRCILVYLCERIIFIIFLPKNLSYIF